MARLLDRIGPEQNRQALVPFIAVDVCRTGPSGKSKLLRLSRIYEQAVGINVVSQAEESSPTPV